MFWLADQLSLKWQAQLSPNSWTHMQEMLLYRVSGPFLKNDLDDEFRNRAEALGTLSLWAFPEFLHIQTPLITQALNANITKSTRFNHFMYPSVFHTLIKRHTSELTLIFRPKKSLFQHRSCLLAEQIRVRAHWRRSLLIRSFKPHIWGETHTQMSGNECVFERVCWRGLGPSCAQSHRCASACFTWARTDARYFNTMYSVHTKFCVYEIPKYLTFAKVWCIKRSVLISLYSNYFQLSISHRGVSSKKAREAVSI